MTHVFLCSRTLLTLHSVPAKARVGVAHILAAARATPSRLDPGRVQGILAVVCYGFPPRSLGNYCGAMKNNVATGRRVSFAQNATFEPHETSLPARYLTLPGSRALYPRRGHVTLGESPAACAWVAALTTEAICVCVSRCAGRSITSHRL